MIDYKDLFSSLDLDDILQENAKNVIIDIRKRTSIVLHEFYRDYDPVRYKRVKGMGHVLDHIDIDKKYTKTSWLLTFTFSEEGITKHGKKAGEVFNGPFMQGYHGGPHFAKSNDGWSYELVIPPRLKPSPFERIEKYVYDNY